MQSVLVVSKDKEARRDYLLSLCRQNNIDKIDIDWRYFDKIVGIEDIRSFQTRILLKPIKSKTKAAIIEANNGFTIEAQNAILKALEEPPANTIIYIIIENKNFLVPTILSRCKIVELKENSLKLAKEEIIQYVNILTSLPQKATGEKLKLAQDIARNKEDVLVWLEKMILATREIILSVYKIRSAISNQQSASQGLTLQSYPVTQLINVLTSFQKAYIIIKTSNANQRLIVENLLLRV